jgi:hypothetical protein
MFEVIASSMFAAEGELSRSLVLSKTCSELFSDSVSTMFG